MIAWRDYKKFQEKWWFRLFQIILIVSFLLSSWIAYALQPNPLVWKEKVVCEKDNSELYSVLDFKFGADPNTKFKKIETVKKNYIQATKKLEEKGEMPNFENIRNTKWESMYTWGHMMKGSKIEPLLIKFCPSSYEIFWSQNLNDPSNSYIGGFITHEERISQYSDWELVRFALTKGLVLAIVVLVIFISILYIGYGNKKSST